MIWLMEKSRYRSKGVQHIQVHQREKKKFFERINNSGSKLAILSILPGFTKKCKPSAISNKFPPLMSDLFDAKNVELSHGEFQKRCKTIVFTVTQNQAENVEK